jgi:hypothetical protein
MRFIEKKGKIFIFEINDNRLVAANEQKMEKGHFISDRPDGNTRRRRSGDGIFKGLEISGSPL